MRTILLTILLIWLFTALSGCTIHFKAKELELDADRQRIEVNHTYELEKVVLFDGLCGSR